MLFNYENFLNETKEYETIKDPNFSIVVPGGCNAHCDFCFWNKTKINENYFPSLNETMNNLPSQFYQLSITGGEPTISPYFEQIIEMIDTDKFKHTVLTTNGAKLLEHVKTISGKIKHVNISRHHWDDKINESIFKTNTVPNKNEIRKIINELHKEGIDVTLSVVLTEHFKSKKDTDKFIDFAKFCGADSVFFRKQHGPDIDKTDFEKQYESHEYVYKSNCPVCRTYTQIIKGIPVSWKSSKEEPSNDMGYIYEVIFNENGKLTSDWESKNILDPKKIKNPESKLMLEGCGSYEPVGCGSYDWTPRKKKEPSGCGSYQQTGCGSFDWIPYNNDNNNPHRGNDGNNNPHRGDQHEIRPIKHFKIGDKIILTDKTKRRLSPEQLKFLLSKRFFIVKNVNKHDKIDIGYRTKNGKSFYFDSRRFDWWVDYEPDLYNEEEW